MAVPRNRHSNARKKTKRAHDAKSPVQLRSCPSCGKTVRHHYVCEKDDCFLASKKDAS